MAPLELGLRLALIGLLIRPAGDLWLRPGFLALALLGVAWPRALHSAALWAALAALAAARIALSWPLGDNHAYLLAYACLAAALALRTSEPERAFATSARLLVGLAFGFAALWKLALSPDFLDGSAFAAWFVADERFEPVALWAAGLSDQGLVELRARLGAHADVSSSSLLLEPAPLRLWLAAWAASAWTIALETAIAFAFLSPRPAALSLARDLLLLVFCVTTYAIAPVAGFGWLLLALGVAQAAGTGVLRGAYVAAYVLVAVYDVLQP